MKKNIFTKTISLCITLVMLLVMAIPQGLSVIAAEEFVEDKIFFDNSGDNDHGSSGAGTASDPNNTASWTMVNDITKAVISDPEDTANKVISVMTASKPNPAFGRGSNIRFDKHGIISERVYFPGTITGALIVNYQPVSGKVAEAVRFTYDSANDDYAITIGGSSTVEIGRAHV